ncbi:hypothetical protein PMI42_00147 [Bradyrhizobium sp. YR681]|uniref:hypothetical protein n=1 Tax=Bradyrhizobium sp. YR681 TaxID=1144344 RepID=UPI000270F568|nr:hypothetical protein [Bradyrhizobium sp. YR681]EJN16312.1 hypothetical protein PMI42_00147 [Bradyrhizobium sp. YR681]
MKAFAVVKLHCLALEILNEVRDFPAVLAPDTASNPFDEASLKEFRPLHELSAGLREAKFQRTDHWANGNTVAYYQAVCRNPETGKFERYAWRYMLSNGQLILHKTFPVIVEDWKDRRVSLVDR